MLSVLSDIGYELHDHMIIMPLLLYTLQTINSKFHIEGLVAIIPSLAKHVCRKIMPGSSNHLGGSSEFDQACRGLSDSGISLYRVGGSRANLPTARLLLA